MLYSQTLLMLFAVASAHPALQPRDNLPSNCRYLKNADLATLSQGEMKLILQYFNSMLKGQTVCSVGAQDSNVAWGCDLQKVISGGFFGGLNDAGDPKGSDDSATGSSLNWKPEYVNAVLHVPTPDQQADIGLQAPIVCLGAPPYAQVQIDQDSCKLSNAYTKGSVTDSQTTVSLSITVDESISYSYTTETDMSITTGLSFTEQVGVEGVESESLTASLSVTVGVSISQGTTKTDDQSFGQTIQLSPQRNRVCTLQILQNTCPGTGTLNTPGKQSSSRRHEQLLTS